MVPGVVGTHGPVVGFFAAEVVLVGFPEFLQLQGFIRKALHHADPFEGIHNGGIDARDLFPVVRECGFHAFVLDGRKPQHDQGHGPQAQTQLPVDAQHDGEGAEDLDQGNEQILRPMVCQFGDVEEVRDNAARKRSCVGAVVESERQPLELFKEIPPHVGFHLRTHDVALAGYVVPAGGFHDVHDEHGGNQPGQSMVNRIGPFKKESAGAPAENQGKGNVHGGDHCGAEQVQKEHAFVGFVERDKILECLHKSPRILIIAAGENLSRGVAGDKRMQLGCRMQRVKEKGGTGVDGRTECR